MLPRCVLKARVVSELTSKRLGSAVTKHVVDLYNICTLESQLISQVITAQKQGLLSFCSREKPFLFYKVNVQNLVDFHLKDWDSLRKPFRLSFLGMALFLKKINELAFSAIMNSEVRIIHDLGVNFFPFMPIWM